MRQYSLGPVDVPKPSEAALIEALRLNDAHVQGLTKLDQQIVYLPLVTLAGAIIAVGTSPNFWHIAPWPVVLVVGLAVTVAVGVGLRRNQSRHEDLRTDRKALRQALGLPDETRSVDLSAGREVYFVLFVIGMLLGSVVLARLLAELPM